MQVTLLPAARKDLFDLWNFGIERFGEARADQFILDLYDALDLLAANPEMAQRSDDLRQGTGRLLIGPYVAFYQIVSDTIEVIRVLHSSRDAGRWL